VARATTAISTANFLALAVFGAGGIAFNLIVYLIAHHGSTPPRAPGSAKIFSDDWIGHLPFPAQWWLLALNGAILLLVAILAWPGVNRHHPAASKAAVVFNTKPDFLAFLAFLSLAVQWVVIGYYDGLVTLLDPFYIGLVLCVAAGVVSFRRWQLDEPVAVGNDARHPSRVAEAIGAVSLADLVIVVVLGIAGVIANQLVYLSAHGWTGPATSRFHNTGSQVWPGNMPLALPWWVFVLVSAIFLGVVIASWSPVRRVGPGHGRRRFFLRTTSGTLLGFAVLLALSEVGITSYYTTGGVHDPAAIAPALALVAAILAAVRWVLDRRREALTPPAPPVRRRTTPTRSKDA
jgi:heme/copper-type cytochrome/quinol oxidase subunit 2